ncbi:MAG: TetR/AcrR family transcriptional regulator [Leptolinea sp.]|jgi:AcrR family transcriptional regulator|nr:TetR/AcrR family transcriptional regulator [Leptolinea sp.]
MNRELSNEKREKFLAAALKLFAANGIQNTSTAEIARVAGTAAGTLFLYFPTKNDLINELAVWIAREEAETIYGRITPSLPVKDMFHIVWDSSIRWLLENPEAYAYTQQIRDSVYITEETTRKTGETFLFYYEAVQKGLEQNLLKPFPADLIGGFLFQDIVAVMNYLRTKTDPRLVDETIQQGFEIFWDGIRIK